ncbi:MAG: hypothetical protein K0U66_04270 [Gammaproteobacteria bacterium]|nr:hypothetical protein [Gammaproteobacteria bacterium]
MLTNTIHDSPATFESAMPLIREREGQRYVNDPNDSGGATHHGITAKTLGRWRRLGRYATNAEVKALTQEEATEIYRSWYWDAPRWEELPEGLRFVCFDMGINSGTGRSMRNLQEVLNLQAGFLKINDRLVEDGHMGDLTIDMAKRVMGFSHWFAVRDLLSIERRSAFIELAEARPKDRGYVLNAKKRQWNGWVTRCQADMSEYHHYTDAKLDRLIAKWRVK